MPSKTSRQSPNGSVLLVFKQERALPSATKVGAGASGLRSNCRINQFLPCTGKHHSSVAVLSLVSAVLVQYSNRLVIFPSTQ